MDILKVNRIMPSSDFENTKNYFMNNLSCLVFRRIETISDIGNLVVIVYQTPFTKYEFDSVEKYNDFITKKGIAYDNKNTIFYYDHYAFTSKTVLRGNDPTFGFRDHIFHGDTANIGIFDEHDLIIHEMPRPDGAGFPLPKVGQLVAGYRYEENIHVYEKWFLCSEQLLHAFSALFTEEVSVVDNGKDIWEQEVVSSESKVNKYGKLMPSLQEQYNDLRELFSGNKLCTNAYRKFFVGCNQNFMEDIPLESQMTEILGMPFFERQSDEGCDAGLVTCPELEKRYVNIITEAASIRYVHFYAFLVLVFKFGIFPTENIIPKNLEKDFPNMKLWDIPDFCKYFIDNLEIKETIIIKNYLKIQ